MKTTPSTAIDILVGLDIETVAPIFSRALASLDAATTMQLDTARIENSLRELVRIRASQLNGCAYCVNQHTRDAVEGGEQIARVAALPVWRESPFFTKRERSALALTDSITLAATTPLGDAEWAATTPMFGPEELGALVALITTINAWNAVGVSTRAWTPEC